MSNAALSRARHIRWQPRLLALAAAAACAGNAFAQANALLCKAPLFIKNSGDFAARLCPERGPMRSAGCIKAGLIFKIKANESRSAHQDMVNRARHFIALGIG